MIYITKCEFCGYRIRGEGKLHGECQRTKFQIEEIINLYLEGEPPDWLTNALAELSWLYEENIRYSSFFNAASEIAEFFIIGGEQFISIDTLDTLNISSIPNSRIIQCLVDSKLIEVNDNKIFPTKILKQGRNEIMKGNELGSEIATNKRKEFYGFLAVSLTKMLMDNLSFGGFPHDAIAIFQVISFQMYGAEEGENVLTPGRITSGMRDLTKYRRMRKCRKMAGFDSSGHTKIIKDKQGEDYILKDEIVEYVDQMRERYRDREREDRFRHYSL